MNVMVMLCFNVNLLFLVEGLLVMIFFVLMYLFCIMIGFCNIKVFWFDLKNWIKLYWLFWIDLVLYNFLVIL